MTLAPMNREQESVVGYINNSDEHVFVTGKAGAGKTHVLHHFRQMALKEFLVCAPTGIAALNANGFTVHNLLGLGTGLPADMHTDIEKVRSKRSKLLKIDTLIIDEISMASADLIDSIDRVLRQVRREESKPFGGVQVVMFGDPYQLPPVIPEIDRKEFYNPMGYRSEWFFDAEVWQETDFATFELQTIHRQSDDYFKELLNGVRDGTIPAQQLAQLNIVGSRNTKTKESILLGARKKRVEDYNATSLAKLRTPPQVYTAKVSTGYGRDEPAERVVRLKPGAHVMMLNNDRSERWVNGSRGVVKTCNPEWIEVELADTGESHLVEPAVWVPAGTAPEDYPTAPKFVQMPVKLAWAITIHKAQGLSLSEIEVDMGSGAFSPGQTYVALSRVTTPSGLHVRTPLSLSDIMVDRHVKRFFANTRIES